MDPTFSTSLPKKAWAPVMGSLCLGCESVPEWRGASSLWYLASLTEASRSGSPCHGDRLLVAQVIGEPTCLAGVDLEVMIIVCGFLQAPPCVALTHLVSEQSQGAELAVARNPEFWNRC